MDLSTHPLHFETQPVDAPPHADLVGMALLVAWAAEKFGLPKKHKKETELLSRAITPRTFLIQKCGKTLTSADVSPKAEAFLYGYTNRMFLDGDSNPKIAKLLRLHREDERAYTDDFLGTFKDVKNPYYVPDSWDAVDRIAPILDARWADYQTTKFKKPADVKLYAKAAKLRDAKKIVPTRGATPLHEGDAKLGEDLAALVDKRLDDKLVLAVFDRAGLPIGKKIDRQANPALGVSYMGVKAKGKMVVDSVEFWAKGQTCHVRSMGTDVQFLGFPSPLPYKLAFGMAPAAVAKLLGKPSMSYGGVDRFPIAKKLLVSCAFKRNKLVAVDVGKPLED
jgi:hypothetical protein